MRNIIFENPTPERMQETEDKTKQEREQHAKNRMGSIMVEKDGGLQRLDGGELESSADSTPESSAEELKSESVIAPAEKIENGPSDEETAKIEKMDNRIKELERQKKLRQELGMATIGRDEDELANLQQEFFRVAGASLERRRQE